MNYPKNLYFTSSVAVALAEAMPNNLITINQIEIEVEAEIEKNTNN